MFDSFYIEDANEKRVCCAAGHVQRGELQTKDLDCDMDVYRYFDGALFVSRRGEAFVTEQPLRREGDMLVRVTEYRYAKHDESLAVHVYMDCDECDPIVSEGAADWMGNRVHTHQPWGQWMLRFDKGVLVEVVSDRCETREDVRQKQGAAALPDDDRIAKKTIAQYHANRLAKLAKS